jgi:hypothetical protein
MDKEQERERERLYKGYVMASNTSLGTGIESVSLISRHPMNANPLMPDISPSGNFTVCDALGTNSSHLDVITTLNSHS